jgi:hypothetical protein
MTSQNRRLTPGKRAVRLLNKTLAAGCEWDEREQLLLAMIERAEDRAAALRELFDAEVAKPQVSTRRVTDASAELRHTEAMIARLAAELVPNPDESAPKSARHVAASRTRWDKRSHRPVPITGA